MESKLHKYAKLQRRFLEAAALGSVKVLRSLVDSHREYIAKQVRKTERRASREHRKRERRASEEHRKSKRRASKERGRQNHEYPAFKSGSRHHKRRFEDGAREVRNRGEKRKRKEETNSESGSRDTDELPDSEAVLGGSSASDTDVRTYRGNPSPTLHDIVNARDAQGLTPLHHACYAGSDRAVKYLLSEGANVHCRDMRGNTPLHIAAKIRSPSLVSLLQKAGADIEAFNDDGETPSDVVARNEEAKKAQSDYVEQQSWYSHLADELSEDEWWGESFSEVPEPQEWESILEMMAEKSQARGLYNDDFVTRRYIREKKPRKEKKPSEEKAKVYMEEKRSCPEEVNLQMNSALVDTRTYNQRWQSFSKTYNLCLSYADIPFPVPEGKEETLAQVLLYGVDPSLQKDALRKEILKWHPDKFLQKWGPKLQGPDHERIVRRVNEISQALNVLYKGIASSK